MGWSTGKRPKGVGVADFLINHTGALSWSLDTAKYRVLDSAVVKMKTFYAAVERIDNATGERRVWAAVFAVEYSAPGDDNLAWRDMDESMGPDEDECPERILALLTPTEHAEALHWRARCWKRVNDHKAKPKVCLNCTVVWRGKRYKVVAALGRMGWTVEEVATGAQQRMNLAQVRECTEVILPAPAEEKDIFVRKQTPLF